MNLENRYKGYSNYTIPKLFKFDNYTYIASEQ